MTLTNINTTWVTSRTWTAGELVTATIMNAHVRDQLNALKTPAGAYSNINEGADYTTTSTSFADIDATDLLLTFTTGGGDVEVHFTGSVQASAAPIRGYFELLVDGVANIGDDGHEFGMFNTSAWQLVTFSRRVSGLSAASHTFKLQWKTSSGTLTMNAGAGTANHDTHPQFWAKEIA